MKYDFDLEILDLNNKPIIDPKTRKPILLKTIAVNALLLDKADVLGTKKIENFKLSKKIYR